MLDATALSQTQVQFVASLARVSPTQRKRTTSLITATYIFPRETLPNHFSLPIKLAMRSQPPASLRVVFVMPGSIPIEMRAAAV